MCSYWEKYHVDKRDGAYSDRLLIRVHAALPPCCEVAVNLEGVAGTALVWVYPVLA